MYFSGLLLLYDTKSAIKLIKRSQVDFNDDIIKVNILIKLWVLVLGGLRAKWVNPVLIPVGLTHLGSETSD